MNRLLGILLISLCIAGCMEQVKRPEYFTIGQILEARAASPQGLDEQIKNRAGWANIENKGLVIVSVTYKDNVYTAKLKVIGE